MRRKAVGLFRDQESRELARYMAGVRNPFELYRKTLWYKARPRSRAYMSELFRQCYPDGDLVCLEESPDWRSAVAEADLIVLLYADAIGLGFADVEGELAGHLLPWAAVRVLNGRRRDFVLNRGTLWALRARRLLERTMLGEAVFLLAFVCVTPLMLVSDLIGRRRDR